MLFPGIFRILQEEVCIPHRHSQYKTIRSGQMPASVFFIPSKDSWIYSAYRREQSRIKVQYKTQAV